MLSHHAAGIRLQSTDRIADGEIHRKHDKHVDVIFRPADRDGTQAMIAGDPGKIVP